MMTEEVRFTEGCARQTLLDVVPKRDALLRDIAHAEKELAGIELDLKNVRNTERREALEQSRDKLTQKLAKLRGWCAHFDEQLAIAEASLA
jgi:hypothetical protein